MGVVVLDREIDGREARRLHSSAAKCDMFALCRLVQVNLRIAAQ